MLPGFAVVKVDDLEVRTCTHASMPPLGWPSRLTN